MHGPFQVTFAGDLTNRLDYNSILHLKAGICDMKIINMFASEEF